MAGANVTKKALASALKGLTNEMPFSNITVEDICERCEMNRTSFYYHFKDKYDLANWIFDMEFVKIVNETFSQQDIDDAEDWRIYEKLSEHLYSNRNFYCSVFQIKGQNSLSEHFRELGRPMLANRLQKVIKNRAVHEFHIAFFTDAALCAIERWITDKECMPPDQFMILLKSCVSACANITVDDV